MQLYIYLIAACWVVFLLVWGVSSLSAKRNASADARTSVSRLILGAVVLCIFAVNYFTHGSLFHPRSAADPMLSTLAVALCAIGIGIAVWARMYLASNWGMPQSVKENPELVTTRPYAYVRHPIYSGVILALIGTMLMYGWLSLIIAVLYAAYFIYSATQEESLMLRTFPDTYPAYKSRTKMLIPFVF